MSMLFISIAYIGLAVDEFYQFFIFSLIVFTKAIFVCYKLFELLLQ